jgi:hypothetical protein
LKLSVKFNDIYLVGYNENKSSSHRVTERVGIVKPKEVKFFGNVATETPDVCYGVIQINEDLWQHWFSKGPFIKGMETAESAARELLKESGVYYGCPLCSFKTKDVNVNKAHIADHVSKFITQFEVTCPELEEELERRNEEIKRLNKLLMEETNDTSIIQ